MVLYHGCVHELEGETVTMSVSRERYYVSISVSCRNDKIKLESSWTFTGPLNEVTLILGYATTETPPIAIGEGEVVEVEVRLAVEVVQLEPLTVVVRRPETQRERDLREYYGRVEQYGDPRLGSTQIYSRDYLQRWDAYSLADAFRHFILWRPNCEPKVFLDGQEIPRDQTKTNGWDYTDDTYLIIELYGSYCDQLQDGAEHQLTATFECIVR